MGQIYGKKANNLPQLGFAVVRLCHLTCKCCDCTPMELIEKENMALRVPGDIVITKLFPKFESFICSI